jgi:hypothetical protein
MRIPVAIVAKVPAAGEVKTRLCPPLTPAQAAGLARCFLQDRVAQLREIPTVAPAVAFTPPEREPELARSCPTVCGWSRSRAPIWGPGPGGDDHRPPPARATGKAIVVVHRSAEW